MVKIKPEDFINKYIPLTLTQMEILAELVNKKLLEQQKKPKKLKETK